MMDEMMKQCCGPDGRADVERLKAFMERCGKKEFSIEEFQLMEEFCARDKAPDAAQMRELMDNCRCHIQEFAA